MRQLAPIYVARKFCAVLVLFIFWLKSCYSTPVCFTMGLSYNPNVILHNLAPISVISKKQFLHKLLRSWIKLSFHIEPIKRSSLLFRSLCKQYGIELFKEIFSYIGRKQLERVFMHRRLIFRLGVYSVIFSCWKIDPLKCIPRALVGKGITFKPLLYAAKYC